MIIGEHNNVIGKVQSIISSFSISTYFYFKKQFNYIIRKLKKIFFRINPLSNSPPLKYI